MYETVQLRLIRPQYLSAFLQCNQAPAICFDNLLLIHLLPPLQVGIPSLGKKGKGYTRIRMELSHFSIEKGIFCLQLILLGLEDLFRAADEQHPARL